MSTVDMTTTLELITCISCGIQWGIPQHWVTQKRQDHSSFHCPNGHTQYFPHESDIERITRQKRDTETALQAQLNEEKHLRLVREKELDSQKRKLRKIEKRIASGVCPCCNRTFEDLHRHMQTKHKDFSLPPGKEKAIAGTVQ